MTGATVPLPDVESDVFKLRFETMGDARLAETFMTGVTLLTRQVAQLGLYEVEPNSPLPLAVMLDNIDKSIHAQSRPDPDLSKRIGRLMSVTERPAIHAKVAGTEIVALEDGAIGYNFDPEKAAIGWFSAKRVQKLMRQDAIREERLVRRRKAFEDKALAEAEEIFDRRESYEEQERQAQAVAIERQRVIDRKRVWRRANAKAHRKERAAKLGEKLSPRDIKLLQYLNLPDKERAELLDTTEGALRTGAMNLKRRLGLRTREELALWGLHNGVVFDLPSPPHLKNFTMRERQVAWRLASRNPDIAKQLNISGKKVHNDVMSLLAKTGARNRTELALVARVFDFEPRQEELDSNIPEALKPFTEFQRPVLSRLHLPTEIIAGELGISKYAVIRVVRRACAIQGTANRINLALKLHEQGLEFDIKEPKNPLHEIMTAREQAFAKSLALPNPEVAKMFGMEDPEQVSSLINYLKVKTGARTREELLLMVKVHDTGEARPVYHNVRPRIERLFEVLGIDPVPLEEVKPLLEHVTPKQAAYIEAYYFSDQEVSWRAISEQFFVRKETAIQIANRGLAQLRLHLRDSQAAKVINIQAQDEAEQAA